MPDSLPEDGFSLGNFHLNHLDEILFRDPPHASAHTEVVDGMTKLMEVITFADGSKLALFAQVSLPPLADMTPSRVISLKGSGEKCEKLDDGTQEALDLARQSAALRLMVQISKAFDEMPEALKMRCPVCRGRKSCPTCAGAGCRRCKLAGTCAKCGGRGVVLAI